MEEDSDRIMQQVSDKQDRVQWGTQIKIWGRSLLAQIPQITTQNEPKKKRTKKNVTIIFEELEPLQNTSDETEANPVDFW